MKIVFILLFASLGAVSLTFSVEAYHQDSLYAIVWGAMNFLICMIMAVSVYNEPNS